MRYLPTSIIFVLALLGGALLSVESVSAQEPQAETSAASEPQDASEDTPSPPIEEIVVTAEQSFFLLNSQIKYATQRLYSVYNDLNEIEEYNVDCRNSDWTGTHIQVQECWPKFFDEIVAQNSQDSRMGIEVLMTVSQLAKIHADKFEALRANITRVANEHPSAADALLELGKLEQALKEKRERCEDKQAILFIFKLCD